MPQDKYTATWVSHSSIGDYLECPRAYYLKNFYRDHGTGNKIALITPVLALGQAVHEVIESLSSLKKDERFIKPLHQRLEVVWERVSGKKGGFLNPESEHKYKKRAEIMLERLYQHPGPLARLAVKIQKDLPYFWLSQEDNIILCGKIDWMEYLPDTKSVHIIDFKTGRRRENSDSLQLPIYYLVVGNCQKRPVTKISYWHLAIDNAPQEAELLVPEKAHSRVLEAARKIKLARQLNKFDCPGGSQSCRACRPFERILAGAGELVGSNQYGADLYILPERQMNDKEEESVIL